MRHNQSVLFIATRNCCLENVTLLVDAGADVNMKDSMNETALFPAVEMGCREIVEKLVEVKINVISCVLCACACVNSKL